MSSVGGLVLRWAPVRCILHPFPDHRREVDVRRIAPWILLVIALLSAALLWVGIDERHEIGPVPMILGGLWALFVLASAPLVFSQRGR